MSQPGFLSPVTPLPSMEPLSPAAPLVPLAQSPQASSLSFDHLVTQGIEQVNSSLLGAEVDMQRLASGDVANLHQVMLRIEQSRLTFQLALQLRNRALESYQELMRMQV